MKYTEYADGERCGPGRAWHHRRTSRPAVTGDVRPELWMARDGRPLPASEVAARPAKWFREQNRGGTLPDGGKNRFREQNGGLVLPQGLEEELPGTKTGQNVPGRGGGPA